MVHGRMQDPREPRAVCRQHLGSREPFLLRQRGTLARGAARAGWPVVPARLRRRVLYEGGGDVTRRRSAWVGPAAGGGGIGSEPEPEPWSAAVAACRVTRRALASGGSGAVVARALCAAACWARRSPGRFVGGTLFPTSLSTAPVLHASHSYLGPAGLSVQARLRRRLLLEDDGDVTNTGLVLAEQSAAASARSCAARSPPAAAPS